jgi:hypothetical protein
MIGISIYALINQGFASAITYATPSRGRRHRVCPSDYRMPIPPALRTRLIWLFDRLKYVEQQIKELERERVEAMRHSDESSVERVR